MKINKRMIVMCLMASTIGATYLLMPRFVSARKIISNCAHLEQENKQLSEELTRAQQQFAIVQKQVGQDAKNIEEKYKKENDRLADLFEQQQQQLQAMQEDNAKLKQALADKGKNPVVDVLNNIGSQPEEFTNFQDPVVDSDLEKILEILGADDARDALDMIKNIESHVENTMKQHAKYIATIFKNIAENGNSNKLRALLKNTQQEALIEWETIKPLNDAVANMLYGARKELLEAKMNLAWSDNAFRQNPGIQLPARKQLNRADYEKEMPKIALDY